MLNQQILEAVLQGQLIFCWIIGGNATPNAGVVLFQWAQIDIGEQKMFDEGVEGVRQNSSFKLPAAGHRCGPRVD
jgi:hypothetical protein